MIVRTSLAALATWLVAACGAESAAFRPTEPTRALARDGEPAAEYEVRDAQGGVAQARVWSRGAFRDEQHRTVVDVAFEVQNLTASPIRLDLSMVELEAFDRAGRALPRPLPPPIAPPGTRVIAGSSALDFEVQFVVPARVAPTDIGSLRVRWALQHSDGRRYVQFTDFIRDERTPAVASIEYLPVFGFYDPFFEDVLVVHDRVPVRRVVMRRPHVR